MIAEKTELERSKTPVVTDKSGAKVKRNPNPRLKEKPKWRKMPPLHDNIIIDKKGSRFSSFN